MSRQRLHLKIFGGMLIIIILAGCGVSIPTQTLSEDEYEQAVFDLCKGNRDSVEGAKSYDLANSYHPIMWIDAEFSTFSAAYDSTYYLYMPNLAHEESYAREEDWLEPESIYDYELVACQDFLDYERERFQCNYGSVRFKHMDTNYEFSVYVLESGEKVGSFVVTAQAHGDCAITISTTQTGDQFIRASLELDDSGRNQLRRNLERYVFTGPDS